MGHSHNIIQQNIYLSTLCNDFYYLQNIFFTNITSFLECIKFCFKITSAYIVFLHIFVPQYCLSNHTVIGPIYFQPIWTKKYLIDPPDHVQLLTGSPGWSVVCFMSWRYSSLQRISLSRHFETTSCTRVMASSWSISNPLPPLPAAMPEHMCNNDVIILAY